MTRPGGAATPIWAVLAIIAAAIVAHASYTADLSAFLPRSPTATQQLLIEQLRSGPAARLLLLAIEGGSGAERSQVSAELARRLRANPAFVAVNNGDAAGLERDREFLLAHRYQLSESVTPERFSAAGLRAAITDSLDLLASPAGTLLKPLFTRDPTGAMLGILDTLGAGRLPRAAEGVWSSPDGRHALLMAQVRAAGSDTDAQQAACDTVRRAFASSLGAIPAAARPRVTLLMTGPPVFAVASRALIKGQVMRLSALAALLVAVLLLTVYRSLPALALTLVPVASGALAGVAAVALGFPAVHGITLGFGITLIGEAVDYSIYFFVQQAADWQHSVWPTIRLGMLTSICGLAALLPSAFPGLAQLGLYSVTGLVAAALVTRFVLPAWLPRALAIRDLSGLGVRLARYLPPLAVQRARQASLPPPTEIGARLREALSGAPVSASRLEPFVLDVERARSAPPLTRADLEGTSFAAAVDALLVRSADGWSALLPLVALGSGDLEPAAVAQVRAALAGEPRVHTVLLDLKAEADRLYSSYLTEAARLALAGLGAIVLLLVLALRSPGRVARVVAPLALAVLAVAGVLVALGGRLTILHLVGMLLIVAVGSNYALFFDRSGEPPGRASLPLTLASLLVANIATVLTFAVLACSRVPVLAELGSTVAPGTLLALVFSAQLSRPQRPAAPAAAGLVSAP